MIKRFSFVFILALFAGQVIGQAVKVDVRQTDNGWELIRGGEPYYVKGAGGKTNLDALVKIGGNSIRTWSADDALEVLDEAHKKGLTVMMGLWVGHERHGFDYDNESAVKSQLERFTRIVKKLKDHPALLLWGIGNEVDLFYSNTKVWYAVNDIAKMIHEIDPNHPTSTVTAGFDPAEAKLIMERAPEIDIYSINTYGDLGALNDAITKTEWTGPYMVTEWGPDGHWEVKKTTWDAPIEQSSSEKGEAYYKRYKEHIEPHPNCVGSYVFLWGQKQETTETWYGLFSIDGHESEVIDKLAYIWNGKYPENRAPLLKNLNIDGRKKGDEIVLTGGKKYNATIDVSDPDNDNLIIKWRLNYESTSTKAGGDFEEAISKVPGSVKNVKGNSAVIKAPLQEGAYRLFVFVYDQNGHFAYDNIPVYSISSQGDDIDGVRFKNYTMDSFDEDINKSIIEED